MTTEAVRRASIFPPRTGPRMERQDRAVLERLDDELQTLRTDLLADPAAERQGGSYGTDTPGVLHGYDMVIARRGPFKVVAWLARQHFTAFEEPLTPADSLSLNGPALPPEVGDGYFIFREGNGFNTDGDIDFAPATRGPCEHEGGTRKPVVAITASQLGALAAELAVINQLPH